MSLEARFFWCGVVGSPVDHSWSPDIFSILARETGSTIQYKKISLLPDQLEAFFRICKATSHLHGVNITLPLKEASARIADVLSLEARTLGAMNVGLFQEGKVYGYNTDVYGVVQTFLEKGISLEKRTAVVYGAGGGALSAAFAITQLGASRILFVNRTLSRAEEVCAKLRPLFQATEFIATSTGEVPDDVFLYLNATPVGLGCMPSSRLLPDRPCSKAYAFDLVYNPMMTPFLLEAESQGLSCLPGIDMLIWQALATWDIWFEPLGEKVKLKQMIRQKLIEKYSSGTENVA